jgi:hypothetical protein
MPTKKQLIIDIHAVQGNCVSPKTRLQKKTVPELERLLAVEKRLVELERIITKAVRAKAPTSTLNWDTGGWCEEQDSLITEKNDIVFG